MSNSNTTSLEEVRKKSKVLYEHVASSKSMNWELNLENMENVKEHILKLIERDYNNTLALIPPHSRLRHHPFINEFITTLRDKYKNDECVKRGVLDMLVISCLLDASAGDKWSYKNSEGRRIGRSEGIAQAVQDMYLAGLFNDLQGITLENLEKGFQVTDSNPMNGLENRLLILHKLFHELENNPLFSSTKRPSAFIDQKQNVDLWEDVVMNGFAKVYPKKDEWMHHGLNLQVPFFKLQQWLAYTLQDALHTFSSNNDITQIGLTALPEYRNGGLFIDHQVLVPKEPFSSAFCRLEDDIVIEWRACTITLCDMLLEMVEEVHFGITLAQLLEAGTWKAGREMAALIRPTTKSSPIPLQLDGTIF